MASTFLCTTWWLLKNVSSSDASRCSQTFQNKGQQGGGVQGSWPELKNCSSPLTLCTNCHFICGMQVGREAGLLTGALSPSLSPSLDTGSASFIQLQIWIPETVDLNIAGTDIHALFLYCASKLNSITRITSHVTIFARVLSSQCHIFIKPLSLAVKWATPGLSCQWHCIHVLSSGCSSFQFQGTK